MWRVILILALVGAAWSAFHIFEAMAQSTASDSAAAAPAPALVASADQTNVVQPAPPPPPPPPPAPDQAQDANPAAASDTPAGSSDQQMPQSPIAAESAPEQHDPDQPSADQDVPTESTVDAPSPAAQPEATVVEYEPGRPPPVPTRLVAFPWPRAVFVPRAPYGVRAPPVARYGSFAGRRRW